MPEIAVLCDICGKNLAKHSCKLCGKRVCDKDFDLKSGMCLSCKRGKH